MYGGGGGCVIISIEKYKFSLINRLIHFYIYLTLVDRQFINYYYDIIIL